MSVNKNENNYRRFLLTYPHKGKTIHKSSSLKKAVKKCYGEFKNLNDINEGLFAVTDLDKQFEYQFRVKNKKIFKINNMTGGKRVDKVIDNKDPVKIGLTPSENSFDHKNNIKLDNEMDDIKLDDIKLDDTKSNDIKLDDIKMDDIKHNNENNKSNKTTNMNHIFELPIFSEANYNLDINPPIPKIDNIINKTDTNSLNSPNQPNLPNPPIPLLNNEDSEEYEEYEEYERHKDDNGEKMDPGLLELRHTVSTLDDMENNINKNETKKIKVLKKDISSINKKLYAMQNKLDQLIHNMNNNINNNVNDNKNNNTNNLSDDKRIFMMQKIQQNQSIDTFNNQDNQDDRGDQDEKSDKDNQKYSNVRCLNNGDYDMGYKTAYRTALERFSELEYLEKDENNNNGCNLL